MDLHTTEASCAFSPIGSFRFTLLLMGEKVDLVYASIINIASRGLSQMRIPHAKSNGAQLFQWVESWF